MSSNLKTTSFATLSESLMRCILTNDHVGVKRLFVGISQQDRKLLVSRETHSNAPLFVAAKRGNLAMVKLLTTKCGANIEERGTYMIVGDDGEQSRHLVTPLWCAAAEGKLGVVKLLTKLGADFDAASDTGLLALQYAIVKDQLSTVQLLLALGSDPFLKNEFGDDVLQAASIRGQPSIVEELLSKANYSTSRRIESFQLMGGYFLDEKEDFDTAMKYWRTAVELRMANPSIPLKVSAPNPAYLFAREVNTVEDLEAICQDLDKAYMYSLMVRERILGSDHCWVLRGLTQRSRIYCLDLKYKRHMDLSKYAVELQHNPVGILTSIYVYLLQELYHLLWLVHKDIHRLDRTADFVVGFDDVYDVLEMATTKMERIKEIKTSRGYMNQGDQLLTFKQIILQLINLLTSMDTNQDQTLLFKKVVYRLVHCTRNDQMLPDVSGTSLLHIAVDPATSHISGEFFSRFPSSAVVEVLLECGADANSIDMEQNTPLHLCSKTLPNLPDRRKAEMGHVINLLLFNSAHVDAVNSSGNIAGKDLTINMWNFVSLQCLAATVIRTHQIPFVGRIPVLLEKFVKMHGQREH